MRITALALIVSLFSLSASDALASSTVAATAAKVDQEHLQWQKVAEAISLGTKVKVQTLDGKRLGGTLLRVDDTSVQTGETKSTKTRTCRDDRVRQHLQHGTR